LTKTVALEVAETPITCNAICPGYVKTPLVEGQIRDQAKAHGISEEQVIREVILASQPNKRFFRSRNSQPWWFSCALIPPCRSRARPFRSRADGLPAESCRMEVAQPRFVRRTEGDKVVLAAEAVAPIRDGDTLATSGFVGIGFAEEIVLALEARFPAERAPRALCSS